MEVNIDKECSALGGLFQAVINDMKSSTPVWDDFISKATKLHATLRATILAAGAFLETFQKVADMATSTRGATREIGSALTRLCMRHRSIESKLKAFTSSIMDMLVIPMQEKMEEWKKTVIQLDKDHAKDYKKARQEIKRASSDTMRLQKKVKKGKSDMQNRLDNAMQDVNDKFLLLEESEKNAVRTALIEERSRFCLFISCLKPVVDEEIAMLTEITHLQEILDSLCMQAGDPNTLPSASEQVILDLKSSDNTNWQFQQSPPSSPSSIGSRKSSMCSISSMNSSSSGSSKSHSPSHYARHRTTSQPPAVGAVRLSSVSSQDSGFTSQDTLFMKVPTPPPNELRKSSLHENSSGTSTDSTASTPSPSYSTPSTSASTWSNWPEPPNHPRADPSAMFERPHTISTAYERSHNRPALTSQTFEPPDAIMLERSHSATAPPTPNPYAVPCIVPAPSKSIRDCVIPEQHSPPVGPKPRGRPVAPPTVPDFNKMHVDQSKRINIPVIPQPVYVNMNELAHMAVQKHREAEERHRQQQLLQQQQQEKEDIQEEEEEEEEEHVPVQQQHPPQHQPQKQQHPPQQQQHQPQQQQHQPQQQQHQPQQPQQQQHQPQQQQQPPQQQHQPQQQKQEQLQQQQQLLRQQQHAPHQLQHQLSHQQQLQQQHAQQQRLCRTQRSMSMPAQDAMPLARALEDMSTGASVLRDSSPIYASSPVRHRLHYKAPNSAELAEAIKELEASTAALQMTYDDGPHSNAVASRQSLPCSSGYGTMTSSPSISEEVIAAGDPIPGHVLTYGPVLQAPDPNKFFTLPRSGGAISKGCKPPVPKRPASTAGLPSSALMRRGSLTKPTPPLRRSSSMAGTSQVHLPLVARDHDDNRDHRSGSSTPTPQTTPTHQPRPVAFDIMCLDGDDPEPPEPIEPACSNGQMDRLDDSDENINWPPPPPEVLDDQSMMDLEGSRASIGSITESHASIIEDLNTKLLVRPSSTPLVQPGYPGVGTEKRQSFQSESSDDITPTGEAPGDSLLAQIQRGVRLKRTDTNDRSGPKLP